MGDEFKKMTSRIVRKYMIQQELVEEILDAIAMSIKLKEVVDKEILESIEWIKSEAKAGNPQAQYKLGKCYKEGNEVEKDYLEAFKLFLKSSENKILNAYIEIAIFYKNGWGVERNYNEALFWLNKAISCGSKRAYCMLGRFYEKGYGVEVDYEKAIHLYEKAVELKSKKALLYLGMCYEEGKGCTKDLRKAAKLYQEAMTKGVVSAKYKYGLCLYDGIGIIKNKEEGITLIEESAESGFAEAETKMGNYYENLYYDIADSQKINLVSFEYYNIHNNISKEDREEEQKLMQEYKSKALSWWRKAADKENPEALFKLAICYYPDFWAMGMNALYIEDNPIKALDLIKRSANKGYIEALELLGEFYEEGRAFIDKNLNKAKDYYIKASKKGSELAKERLKNLNIQ